MRFFLSRRQRLLWVALYIAFVFIGGALLAPWLYWLAQAAAPEFPRIAAFPFRRFVDRAILGVALLGLWPVLRALQMSPRLILSARPTSMDWKLLAKGFFLGLAMLTIVSGMLLAEGRHELKAPFAWLDLTTRIPRIALTAAGVAILEEALFRGLLFGALRKDLDWIAALLLSSLIYALVHFLDPRATLNHAVTWWSGLEQLTLMLRGLTDPNSIIPAFLNLTLAGVLLGLACQRTGKLYASIGVHAGWVFWIKTYGLLARTAPGAPPQQWGIARLADGWPASLVLVTTLIVFVQWPRPAREEKDFPRESIGAV